jgi:hypothetical protein
VSALVFYVGPSEVPHVKSGPGVKYVRLKTLIEVMAAAISKWVRNYNDNLEKWADFAMRYDLTVSDSRMVYFEIPNAVVEEEI